MIAIIDYDAGNIKSVEKAFISLGQDVVVTRNKDTILSADKVVLPGVGAFGGAMSRLHEYGLVDVIREVAAKGTPKMLHVITPPMKIIQNNNVPIVSPLDFFSNAFPHKRQYFALSLLMVLQLLQIFILKLLLCLWNRNKDNGLSCCLFQDQPTNACMICTTISEE